jgi:hypothetical protein
MPKQWALPFMDILTSHSNEWKGAKGKAERKSVIESVADAINAQLAGSAGGSLEHLEDVSVLYFFQKRRN